MRWRIVCFRGGKWALTVLTVAVAVVWLWSAFAPVRLNGSGGLRRIEASDGSLFVAWAPAKGVESEFERMLKTFSPGEDTPEATAWVRMEARQEAATAVAWAASIFETQHPLAPWRERLLWWTSPTPLPFPVRAFAFPLWMPLFACGLAATGLWWRDRRAMRWARTGCCRSCGYDRRSLDARANCPECGTVPAT